MVSDDRGPAGLGRRSSIMNAKPVDLIRGIYEADRKRFI